MPEKTPPSHTEPRDLHVNFLRPRPGFMRREVTIICLALLAWALASIGFPMALGISAGTPDTSLAIDRYLFGMPWHYWFSGHFLIVWFIFICAIFNLLIDWLTKNYRKRR